MRVRVPFLLQMLALLGGVLPATAQISTGVVTGIVQDEQRLALPGAAVTLEHEGTGDVRHTTSNDQGAFTIPAVTQGRYTLTVSLDGFRTVRRSGIQLTSNEYLNAGVVTLDVGGVVETTTVVASQAVVQTASSEMSSSIEAKQMDSLIARGRDPLSLLRTLPGMAAGEGEASLGANNGSALPIMSGLRAGDGSVSVDGMVSNDADTDRHISAISVDAIEEIKVITNNYQAEYGRSPGGVVNIISKSGTREFRGGVSFYKRHEGLNANNYFNELNGVAKPLYRYNTFSATLGGPVLVPGLSEGARNKLFFFYALENWNSREPRGLRQITTPTVLERQGDFSQTYDLNGRLIPIVDPLTGQPFPGNRIPADRIDPYGQALLSLFPQPNFFDTSVSRGAYNYRDEAVDTSRKRLHQLKTDYNATSRDRLSVRWRKWSPIQESYRALAAVTSNWNQLVHAYTKTEDSIQVNHAHTFGNALVNELTVSSRWVKETGPSVGDGITSMQRANTGMSGLPTLYQGVNPYDLVPTATFGGVSSAPSINYDARFPIESGDERYSVADNLSWHVGTHLVKAGFYYERNMSSEGISANCFAGCFNFQASATNPLNTGYAFANAMLGVFHSYSESNARMFRGGKSDLVEWFVQDSWRARPNLVLDFGVRFTHNRPWSLRDGQLGGSWVAERYDPAAQPRLFFPTRLDGQRVGYDAETGQVVPATLIGAIVPGSGELFNGIADQDDPLAENGWRDIPPIQLQPRIGFAYDPTGTGRTAIRGGFGITTQSVYASGLFANRVSQGPPARIQPQIFYGQISSLGDSSGYLFPLSGVPSYERDYTPGRIYNYSINFQQSIGLDSVLSVAYVGNRGRHLLQERDLNMVPLGARFDPANADPTTGQSLPNDFLRPIIGYGSIMSLENSGYSDYNSLQATLTRRFRDGLQYGVAYTFSRARNLTDSVDDMPNYVDARDWLYDYAGSDRTHVLSFNYVWNLPNASRRWNNAIARVLLDDWQIAGVTSFATGRPSTVSFTTTDNADITGGGDGSRMNLTGDPLLSRGDRTFERWFDPAVFARPARGEMGNSGRHPIRLPGQHVWDLTVSKSIPLGNARRALQFRAEAYNVFNQTQWTALDTTARFDAQGNQVNARFGQVTAAGDPRIIQLSVRVMF